MLHWTFAPRHELFRMSAIPLARHRRQKRNPVNTGCTFWLHESWGISWPVLDNLWYYVSRNLALELLCSCTTCISNAQPPKRYGAVVANFKLAEMMLTCTCQVCTNKKIPLTYCTPHNYIQNYQRHELSMYVLICGERRCFLWTVPNGQVGRDVCWTGGNFL
jgi:hypothetical protein